MRWTPPLTPQVTYTLGGDTVDSGETCILAVRKDGVEVDPANYQSMFEAALAMTRHVNMIAAVVIEHGPRSFGHSETGAVFITVPRDKLAVAQETIANKFPDHDITVAGV